MDISETAAYAVRWWTTAGAPSDGMLRIDGTRVTLSGARRYSFDATEADAVLVTPEPAVHVRVRRRGWLIVTTIGSGLAFELASTLSQLGVS